MLHAYYALRLVSQICRQKGSSRKGPLIAVLLLDSAMLCPRRVPAAPGTQIAGTEFPDAHPLHATTVVCYLRPWLGTHIIGANTYSSAIRAAYAINSFRRRITRRIPESSPGRFPGH
jgi:hypothetical protein